MDLIIEGLVEAINLILTLDPEVLIIVKNTLICCLSAIAISTLIGVPLGVFLGTHEFRGKRFVMAIIHAGMALPPVVVGLWITILFWRSGLFGGADLLYTKKAIILAQVIVALPIIIGLTTAALHSLDKNFCILVKSLGTTRWQYWKLIIKQVRYGIFAAIIGGLGRVFAEVGAAVMVGANIYHDTQILTTAIQSYVHRGDFGMALALSFILLGIVFTLTAILTFLQKGRVKS